jgi:hypothetical protein
MAWAVRLPDGTTEKFPTFEEAEAFRKEMEAADTRTPEEIYDQHPRPRVPRDMYMKRVADGWSPHRAVDTPPEGRWQTDIRADRQTRTTERLGGRDAQLYEAYGRTRTLTQWSESCGISSDVLRRGAKRHGSLGAYLEHVGWHPTKPPVPDEMTDDTW